MCVSTCISHAQLAESRPWSVINNDLSQLGGYIYSIGLVKAVFVVGTCPCINFVNAGDLK